MGKIGLGFIGYWNLVLGSRILHGDFPWLWHGIVARARQFFQVQSLCENPSIRSCVGPCFQISKLGLGFGVWGLVEFSSILGFGSSILLSGGGGKCFSSWL